MAMGTPSDLSPLKEPLIEAVINAYMAKQVPSTVEGMEWDHGGCAQGEFRFKHSRFGKDAKAYCYYPSGEWKIDIWMGGDHDAASGDRVDDYFDLFDAAATFEMVRTNVSEWVDPWIACSDPHQLSSAISTLGDVVNQLYVQSEVRVEDRLVGGGGDGGGSDQGTTGPVSDVRSAIVDMTSQLSSLNGLAIDALETSYVNDVGLTISGQRALAAIATLAIAGEAEAWSQAFGNLADFFDKAAKDFQSFADGHGASGGGTTLSVVSGVTGLAALATAEFPPAAVTLGAISGLAGLGSTFYPSEEEVAVVTLVLAGGDFDAKWASFGDAVRDVNSALVHAEHSLAIMCRNAMADYDGTPDSYSITEVGRSVSNPQPGDDLTRFLHTDQHSADKELFAGDEIFIVDAKLRAVAAMIEHVGDHQRQVASTLGGGGLESNDWSRSYLQGSTIGWGPSGHRADYVSVVDAVTDLLLLESKTAHRVAEHCLDIATGFSQTDAQIEAHLNQLESRLDVAPRV